MEDIIVEVRKNLNSLRQQAARARQFKTMQDELRSAKIQLLVKRRQAILDRMAILAKEQEQIRDSLARVHAEMAIQEAKIGDEKNRMVVHENEIFSLNRDFF
ncbi:MAG: hypothetical protein MZV49_04770 [Rhodopseudomonas palustris]|nr:hypothetical protein [Rhodopseudomonas palustris]